MASSAQLSACKAYLRVDGEDDDDLISMLLDAAVAYLAKAGVPVREGDALYDLAVFGLVLHWYDNRGLLGDGTAKEVPLGARNLVQTLSLSGSPGF